MTDDSSTTDDAVEGTGDEEMVVDDSEVDAGFLDDLDPENYPSVLRITAKPEDEHRQDALDRIERWESGEDVPHVVNFEDPGDLRALLTDRRVELLRTVMTERPPSIRGLAELLDRDVKSVHTDLRVLADYGVVHFEDDGRAKRPFVPYERIEVSIEITAPERSDDVAPA